MLNERQEFGTGFCRTCRGDNSKAWQGTQKTYCTNKMN